VTPAKLRAAANAKFCQIREALQERTLDEWLMLIAGLVGFLVPGRWAFIRARRELWEHSVVTRKTFVAALAGYTVLALLVLLGAWKGAWELPFNGPASRAAGYLVAGVGILLYLLARLQFGSYRMTWGMESDKLITFGIYRYTRHPQSIGWGFTLLGIALIGGSGVSLILALIYVSSCLIWLPVEEAALERRFGAKYIDYRSRTPL
jgi:protein-S-isoprenylcysteine O-methyltransferase Ste14